MTKKQKRRVSDPRCTLVPEPPAWMGEKEFRAELRYRMSLSVAGMLLEDGVVSEEEYREIDTILLKRHRPVLGTLLAGSPYDSGTPE